MLPDYPPFGKRILLDNGWYAALRRDDVSLVTDPITSVTANAVNGVELDVLVCATGFDVVRFLAPIDIRGRGGAVLREVWDDEDARAYLGTTVPGFPNLLMVYGPNTQAGHGGSLIGSPRRSCTTSSTCSSGCWRRRGRDRGAARRSMTTTTGASTPRTSGWSGRTRRWRRTTATRAGGWS